MVRGCPRWVVWFLLAALVLPATAWGHSHDSAARPCDACLAGLLPALAVERATGLVALAPIAWHAASEQVRLDLDPLLASSPSRAPPA
ncbi:MAG: hypothetical protein HYR60_10140 [Acidobacteria bacterium]|nr:hypothetical protein [Acidobacteriota bacterium]